ncbi:hypothetical protein RF11_00208 [Thelohanellus kitauei]|uniref:Uncharacterized protein n=1 Tax=Thelohanellus kitauei TaxID=669202 RepID=A0A0C2N005_THEKT|nr:hypothetical protein RF11_00208 [Thelohanellus kitauei]
MYLYYDKLEPTITIKSSEIAYCPDYDKCQNNTICWATIWENYESFEFASYKAAFCTACDVLKFTYTQFRKRNPVCLRIHYLFLGKINQSIEEILYPSLDNTIQEEGDDPNYEGEYMTDEDLLSILDQSEGLEEYRP